MAEDPIATDVVQNVATTPAQPQGPPQDKAAFLEQITRNADPNASLYSQLVSNPLFTGGLGLAALGTALRYSQHSLRLLASSLRHRLLVDLEITRHDKSYPWVLQWMTHQYRLALSPSASSSPLDRILTRLTPRLHHLQMETTTSTSSTTTSTTPQTTFHLVPGHGRHILRLGRAFLSVSRERVGKSFDSAGQPFETLKFTTLYAHRHLFERIFAEAHALAQRSVEGKTVVYTLQNMAWMPLGEPRRKRPLGSVVLADGVAERVAGDVRGFLDLATREWYLDRGIPYRRGYLLHGPPGTGKTSFVQALAGDLDYGIAMLSLSQRGLHDDLLTRLLLNVPPRTIVLLEDCDAAFSNRRQVEGDGYGGGSVTFSGLLNALDGVASGEERVVFMTTNHIERLDRALVRPGRVDMMIELGNAGLGQFGRMWDRFYEQVAGDGKMREEFLEVARSTGLDGQISTAALQMVFLDNKDDPEGAITTLREMGRYQETEEARKQSSHQSING